MRATSTTPGRGSKAASCPASGIGRGEPGGAPADHVLHVQRSGLPLRERLLPGLHHLRVERAGAGRPPARDEAHLAPHAARRARASARLDGKHPAVTFFLTNQMRAQLHHGQLNGTLPILYAFLARSGKTVTDVELRHDRARRIGQALRRRARQGRAQRRQDRLHVRRRQAADALLLQHRRLQRRHQEQRLSQVLRGAGHKATHS